MDAPTTLSNEPADWTTTGVSPPQGSIAFRLSPEVRQLLACPVCHGRLVEVSGGLECANPRCRRSFPQVDGVPVLIDPERSLFDVESFLHRQPTFFKPISPLRLAVSRCLPQLSNNVTARRNFARLAELALAQAARPKVLVLGGSVAGAGMEPLLDSPRIELIETDVALGPRAQMICDAHDLPLADASVDAVVAQAVLEHVVDPARCASEIHRVLKPDGLVYADTPFMQQVHGREYDFTRFTRLGHRRLFRHFQKIDSGITCGPGTALAWSIHYFALSFCTHPKLRAAASGLTRLALFWLKYFDYWLARKPAALDAAAAFYFLGRKSEETLSDRELVASYHGGF
jgi:SAM-dependent methyltransferase